MQLNEYNNIQPWLYIESYVFIWKNDAMILLFNYINSKKLIIKRTILIEEIINALLKPDAFYCTKLNEKYLSDKDVRKFIDNLSDNSFGNVVYLEEIDRPIIIPPSLYFNKMISDKHNIINNQFYDSRVLDNLLEITIQLTGKCSNRCNGCDEFYFQMTHCYHSKKELSRASLQTIIKQINFLNIRKINLIGGNLFASESFLEKVEDLCTTNSLRIFHINFIHASVESILSLLNKDSKALIKIIYHYKYHSKKLQMLLSNLSHKTNNIIIVFVLESQGSLDKLNKFISNDFDFQFEIYPFFNGENVEFIKENCFFNNNDLVNLKSSKKQIFANQVINTNYFGKIHICSDGTVYDNVRYHSVGNILNNYIEEIVSKIIINGNSWFWIRNNEFCKDCLFRLLCPPPTNIEGIMETSSICNNSEMMNLPFLS